jgi:hypothetical protein
MAEFHYSDPLPGWYVAWVGSHATAFGFSPQAGKTVLAWGAVFCQLFTEGELHAATRDLMADVNAPKWVDDHRKAIIQAVKRLREAERPRLIEGSRCPDCDGCGWRSVPHPGSRPEGGLNPVLREPADDPLGVNRELAVTCGCTVGVRTYDAERGHERTPLTFLAYTRKYPNYLAVDHLREMVRRAERATPTEDDHRRYTQLAAKLATATRLPPARTPAIMEQH